MANQSVLELAVGTGKWDAGLRKAKQSLDNFTQANGGLEQALNKESDKMQQFVRMMGQMDSTAKTAKGQMNDYKATIEQLTMQYNRMSDAQKQVVGQDYLNSIDQMKQKYQGVAEEVKKINESLASISSSGGEGEGGLTGMLQVAGGNLLSKGISMLAGDLTDTIQKSIELARQGEGVRLAFERLNQPGLLDNLKQATHGTVSEIELMKQAIKFENFKLPLEDLATYLQFAQQKAKDTGESIDFLVTSIVNGLGRQSKQILDNLGISASELTKRMAEGKDMTQAVAEIIREEMAKAGDYVETAADRAAVAAASATDKLEEMGRTAMPVAEAVTEMWNTIRNGGITVLNTVLTPIANSLKYINDLLSNENGIELFEKRLGNTPGMEVGPNVDDNGNYIRRPSHGTLGWNWNTGHYDDEVSSIQEIVVSGTNRKGGGRRTGGGSSGGKKTPSVQDYLNTMYGNMDSLGSSLKGNPDKNFKSPFAMITEEDKRKMMEMKDVTVDLGDAMAKLGEKQVTEDVAAKMQQMTKAAQAQKMALNLAGQAAQNFGAALESIGDPSAKAAGQVVSAIASIAMGFAMASSNANTAGTGWGWLAWLGAGLAAMTTTISTIHSLTGYAEGGMVNGSTYSGDQIPIMANAGEVVLTKAQQGNLASHLQGGGLQNMRLEGVITGENLHIIHNRYLQRTGQGELVTW